MSYSRRILLLIGAASATWLGIAAPAGAQIPELPLDTVQEALPPVVDDGSSGPSDPTGSPTAPPADDAPDESGVPTEPDPIADAIEDQVAAPVRDALQDPVATVTQPVTGTDDGGRNASSGDSPHASAVGGGADPTGAGNLRHELHDSSGVSPVARERGPERNLHLPTLTLVPQGDSPTDGYTSILDQIGAAAVDAAKSLAFPLALVAVVAAFLSLQDRLDRKDPKLAAAPVRKDHDMLSFK